MKWRLCPSLDLAIIKAQSCLILGTGTLGCNIARGLLGWGINQITFVDSGKVHYSNPVRQSLFTQLQVHRSKVDAAVEQIHTILVGGGQQDHEKLNLMNIQGVDMEIPMPGHAVTQGIQELTLKLEDLIKKHSIVFLLTDSRESRWLPTLLGALHQKIVITVALGFDEFVVMRHGMNNDLVKLEETAEQLGCYFCGDIVSPQDSTSQRSLDQQCTISRPGLSMTASAMAVELLATLLQHPDQ